MFFVVAFGMMFGCRLGVLVGQIVLTIGQVSRMGFLLMVASLMQLLSFLVILSGFTEMVSGFFVMFVCHRKSWFYSINFTTV